MKRTCFYTNMFFLWVGLICIADHIVAQDIHFTQYYNAPMLINPANTGLMQQSQWRAGIQYRNQSATVPVPYNTTQAFVDFGLLRNKIENGWLGAGLSVWRDVAGQGNLALTKIQGNLAYHVLMSEKSSLSAGIATAYSQRSVDISKLSFDTQWDDFSFNTTLPSGESPTKLKTTFLDLAAGMNFSYYNNSNIYFKISLAASHINQPVETFYNQKNKLGLRPIIHTEMVYKISDYLILNPSVYYTRQKRASALVTGTLLNINTNSEIGVKNKEIIVGAFYRNKDAIIFAAGYQFGESRFMCSYDHTISGLAAANNGLGAVEISFILQGKFKKDNELSQTFGCPRF